MFMSFSEGPRAGRTNRQAGHAAQAAPGQQVMLHWAAEHSYVVGSEPGAAEIAAEVVTN